MHFKVGDTVVVISGKNKYTVDKKGNLTKTTGKVVKVLPTEDKVIIEGVNKMKKHVKPKQTNQSGSIIEVEAPIYASKVMIADPKSGEPTRIGYKMVGGKKVRYAKKSGEILK